jgi:hypothetical protein
VPANPFDQLSLPLAREVDRACDRFEAAWRTGIRPRIEDYLAEAPPPARPALLWELVCVEACYRRGCAESLTASEYRRRFPDLADLPAWISE